MWWLLILKRGRNFRLYCYCSFHYFESWCQLAGSRRFLPLNDFFRWFSLHCCKGIRVTKGDCEFILLGGDVDNKIYLRVNSHPASLLAVHLLAVKKKIYRKNNFKKEWQDNSKSDLTAQNPQLCFTCLQITQPWRVRQSCFWGKRTPAKSIHKGPPIPPSTQPCAMTPYYKAKFPMSSCNRHMSQSMPVSWFSMLKK